MIEVKLKITIPESIRNMREGLARGMIQTMNEEIPRLSNEIINRTLSGQDVSGANFAPYKPSTIKLKARKGQQTSPVNLSDFGAMLDLQTDYKVKSDGVTGIISVPMTVNYAEYHQKGNRKMAKRKFLGFSKQQILNFKNTLLKNILRNFNK